MVPLHECFLTNGRLDICVSQKRNKSAFKDVLDFYLQPHQGAGTLISGSTKKMPMIQGYYCSNMNDFWYGFTEICTTRETLTKIFVILFKDVLHLTSSLTEGQGPWGMTSWCKCKPSRVTTFQISELFDQWLLRYTSLEKI